MYYYGNAYLSAVTSAETIPCSDDTLFWAPLDCRQWMASESLARSHPLLCPPSLPLSLTPPQFAIGTAIQSLPYWSLRQFLDCLNCNPAIEHGIAATRRFTSLDDMAISRLLCYAELWQCRHMGCGGERDESKLGSQPLFIHGNLEIVGMRLLNQIRVRVFFRIWKQKLSSAVVSKGVQEVGGK